MRGLQSRAADGETDGLLPECFAIVAETIDRRLGVWRLFDDASQPAARGDDSGIIAETAADVARQRRHRQPGDILLPAAFYRAARKQDDGGPSAVPRYR